MLETTRERGRVDQNDHQHSASADLKPHAQEPNPKNTKFEPALVKFTYRQQRSAHLKRNPRSSLSIVDSSSIASTRCCASGGVCEGGQLCERAKTPSSRRVGGPRQHASCDWTENVGWGLDEDS
jgi:hypothetical protein